MNIQKHMDTRDDDQPPDDRLSVAMALVGDAYVDENPEDVSELSEEKREKLLGVVRERLVQDGEQTEGRIVAYWPDALMMAAAAVMVFAFVQFYGGEDSSTIASKTSRKPIIVAPHLPQEIPAAPDGSPVPILPPTEIPNEGLVTPDPERDAVGRNFVKLGNDLFAKGEYEKAIDHFKEALQAQLKAYGRLHPDVAYTYHKIGQAYKAKGEHEQAIEHLEKSLEIFFKVYGR